MLALYDLCAVLTPYGPLKALVNLMSDKDSPEMPGLLYEAQIPDGLNRPVMRGRNGEDYGGTDDYGGNSASQCPPSSMCAERYQQPSTEAPMADKDALISNEKDPHNTDDSASHELEMIIKMNGKETFSNDANATDAYSSNNDQAKPLPSGIIPFAIAKLYRLPLASRPSFVVSKIVKSKQSQNDSSSTYPLLSPDSSEKEQTAHIIKKDDISESENFQYIIPDEEFTPTQMRTLVEAIFPQNGAKILKQPRSVLPSDNHERYRVIGSDGTLKRILFVEKNGKVFEELDDDDDSEGRDRYSNTIKVRLLLID